MSVVVPVYRGERTLPGLLGELESFFAPLRSPDGHLFQVTEVLLVHDNGPDGSARVIRELAALHAPVRPVWLSRNFGQHAATMAGMAASGGEWIVTLDEDGQHDPVWIGDMLDTAMRERADLVYAAPTNVAPHGFLRNLTSRASKRLIDGLSGSQATSLFNSYRLMLADRGRAVADYAGPGVYLDVALGWVMSRVGTCPIELRQEGDRPSGYNYRALFAHFWRMVLTSGTRLLRVVSVVGAAFAVFGSVAALCLVVLRLTHREIVAGWTSTMVVVLVTTGMLMMALGIVAEYLGVAVNMAMGRPLYLVIEDPQDGPFDRPIAPADSDALDPS